MKKKKILFFSYPNYSHELPAFELLNNLDAEIYYYTNKNNKYLEKLNDRIQIIDYNYNFYSDPIIQDADQKCSYDLLADFYILALHLSKAAKVLIDELSEDVKKIKPEIIMYDSFSYWGKIIAYKFGLPSVSSVTFYPFNKNVLNESNSYFMNNYLPKNRLLSLFINKNDKKRMLKILEGKINKKEINYKNIFDIFINYGDLNISYTSKDVLLNNEKYKNFFFLGKQLDLKKEYIKIYRKKIDHSKIVIYVSLGTVFNQNFNFFQKCIDAFKNTDIQVIISIGNRIKKEKFTAIPKNFIIDNFLPQKEILILSDVFITQGGFNSINEGLSAGIPMIVIPQAMDQFTNALCVQKLKTGIFLKLKNITPFKLKKNIYRIYKNTSYKKNCLKIRSQLKKNINLKDIVNRILSMETVKN